MLCQFNLAQNSSRNDTHILSKDSIENALITAKDLTQKEDFFSAIMTLKESLATAQRIDDKSNEGYIYLQIGKLQYLNNNNEEASISLIKATNILRNTNDRINLATAWYISGLVRLKDKLYVEALDYFKSARTTFEEKNQEKLVAEIALYQAICNIELKNLNSASYFLEEATSLSREYKLKSIESAALIKNGIIALSEKNYNLALDQTNKALEIAKSINSAKLRSEGYLALSNIYSANGNFKLENENLRAYLKVHDSIESAKNLFYSASNGAQAIINEKDGIINRQQDEIAEKEEANSLNRLTTILSVALITILSLLTLSLYKNNNIRLKTNNMLYKKNDELLTEKERAEIAAKTKSNFLSTVTHELRTPLYAVTGLTNMLLEENPKPSQIQHLKSLKFSGDYLLTFINDILQINKIEANKVELDPEIFNLKHKVENVISSLSNSASDNNTMIHFQYDKKLPETFDGDQLKISQILINLIGNSIKFTKDGDIWVRVSQVEKNKDIHTVQLEIEDNGIGITKEKQDNMFESFSQGSVQINRKYGGTGLGLSIVKGLVNILNGKIYLKSELGIGTSFFIEIPLEEAEGVTADKKVDYAESITNLDLDTVKILVVEDNKINQMITKKILTKMNFNCELVDNGEDAVEKVQENDYNVVLMDIHMPGISGFEATKRIRSFDKELTIFALTAVTLEDKLHEFEEAGFNDIISKPFKQEDFEKKLYEALSGKKTSISVSA